MMMMVMMMMLMMMLMMMMMMSTAHYPPFFILLHVFYELCNCFFAALRGGEFAQGVRQQHVSNSILAIHKLPCDANDT